MTRLAPCLPFLYSFVPSIEGARQITGRNAPADISAALIDAGVGTVALKMGEHGCYVRSRAADISLPALPVQAVDALGAGDAFAAGCIAGVLHGWDLERTVHFANAVGATCVTTVGATTGVRSLDETWRFLETLGTG